MRFFFSSKKRGENLSFSRQNGLDRMAACLNCSPVRDKRIDATGHLVDRRRKRIPSRDIVSKEIRFSMFNGQSFVRGVGKNTKSQLQEIESFKLACVFPRRMNVQSPSLFR